MVDGRVARQTNQVSVFGAFFDSVIDRYSDVAIFFGLLVYYARGNRLFYVGLVAFVMTASLMVSYTRARAEALIGSCKVGFMERPERIVCVILGRSAIAGSDGACAVGAGIFLYYYGHSPHPIHLPGDRAAQGGVGAVAALAWSRSMRSINLPQVRDPIPDECKQEARHGEDDFLATEITLRPAVIVGIKGAPSARPLRKPPMCA